MCRPHKPHSAQRSVRDAYKPRRCPGDKRAFLGLNFKQNIWLGPIEKTGATSRTTRSEHPVFSRKGLLGAHW
jgi:hypothetical protein